MVNDGSNYTLYQEFVTEGNVGDLNITWTRAPPLDPPTDVFRTEKHVINNRTLHASLILFNIQENGRYTVTASNGCGMSNSTVFRMQVHYCSEYDVPEPLTEYNLMVIPEPELPNVLHLYVRFLGSSYGDYQTIWHFEDASCLEYAPHTSHMSCNRTTLQHCRFEAHLWIANVTKENSDSFTVQGVDDDFDMGNSSTIELRTSILLCNMYYNVIRVAS